MYAAVGASRVDILYANTLGAANISSYGEFPACNLKSVTPYDLDHLLNTTDQMRITSDLIVLTNSAQQMVRGGNVVRCWFEGNLQFTDCSWEEAITAQPRSDRRSFDEGACLFNMSWGKYFMFCRQGDFPLNSFSYESGRTVMAYITYTNVINGGSNDSIEVSFTGYRQLDYATNNVLVTRIQVVPSNDAWISYVGYVMLMFRFTSNADHNVLLDILKNAARFIMSGDERAVAIRKGAQLAGKAAINLLPLLLAL